MKLFVTGIIFIGIIAATLHLGYAFTTSPTPIDLYDLAHDSYYTWGINWTVPTGQQITGASLFIDNINNWQVETNALYIHLLDNPLTGVHTYSDTQSGVSDDLSGKGIILTTYVDHGTGSNPPEDWTYNFTPAQITTLNEYIANGNGNNSNKAIFGLGFDPDCHYFNDGIYLTICTKRIPGNGNVVPEPSTMVLLGIGLLGGLSRRLGKKTKTM